MNKQQWRKMPYYTAGIYSLTCSLNGRRYIGETKSFRHRWMHHLSRLASKTHRNPALQAEWDMYGSDPFEFSIVSLCDDQRQRQIEEERLLRHGDNLYNLRLPPDLFTDEQIAAIEALLVDGWQKVRIAKQYDVKPSQISQHPILRRFIYDLYLWKQNNR